MSFEDLRAITAKWLKIALEESALSTDEVAKRSGVARSTIYRLLGEESNADEATIAALSKVLKRPFPRIGVAPDDGPTKTDKTTSARLQEPRSRYSPTGDSIDEDAAYLRTALDVSRQLSAAEQEGAPKQALLRLVDLAEKVMVPIYGGRAKEFLEAERQRIQRGEAGSGSSTP